MSLNKRWGLQNLGPAPNPKPDFRCPAVLGWGSAQPRAWQPPQIHYALTMRSDVQSRSTSQDQYSLPWEVPIGIAAFHDFTCDSAQKAEDNLWALE